MNLKGDRRHRGGMRIVESARQPSRKLLEACASLGIVVRWGTDVGSRRIAREHARIARSLCAGTRAGEIVLICGPSGSGKSTLMREMRRQLRQRGEKVVVVGSCEGGSRGGGSRLGIFDRLGGSIRSRLGVLSRAGLSEGMLLARTAGELSEGQRHRFGLALGIDRAIRRRAAWVFADEFVSMLDRITARGVCRMLSRWVRGENAGVGAGLRFVLASAHEDVAGMVDADVVVWCALDGGVRCMGRAADGVNSKGRAGDERVRRRAGNRDRSAWGRWVGDRGGEVR
ncbi:MAG: AAA family ATPase [Phycisphaerales bacterium]|nr:AAA family ATPase [Phycisphaerales bacterium]